MSPLRLVLLLFFMALTAHAADGGETDYVGTDASGDAIYQDNATGEKITEKSYHSPNISAFGIPSGMLNVDLPNKTKYFQTTPTSVTSATNLLGCGGVGQGEYTSALFNMPEVFGKFQQDVNSPLAKQLLTMNYSLPQTAALFDTLNSYGNQRYDQFQRGCNLDALKQDAKQQYLQACVAEQVPLRKSNIQGSNPQVTGNMLDAQAYAQAWEICQMQYVSNTQALAKRKEVNLAFAKEIRTAEYANIAIRSMLCNEKNGPSTGCWAELFLPQVRVCNDANLEKECTDGEYGVEAAPLRLMPFYDMLRLAVTEELSNKVVNNLVTQINSLGVPAQIQRNAARAAVAKIPLQPSKDALYPNLVDFEKNYMNCRSSDMMWPLQKYTEELNAILQNSATGTTGSNPQITLSNLGVLAFVSQTSAIKLPTGGGAVFQNDRTALEGLVPSLIGCVANQTIPLLDPVIIAETNIQCSADDLDAFYSVASYDLATTATREIYQYLISRLKAIHARLLVEETRPEGTAKGGGTAVDSGGKLPSKELNHRLAIIVDELMIPRLESQLQRLDQLNKARGEFGERVKKIYATKTGCVYNQK